MLGGLLAGLSLLAQAQSYTGVQGTGWREVYMPLAPASRPTAQAAGTYTPRTAVLIQVDDVNGLRNAPIPQEAKDNILRDGFGDGPVYIDRDVVNAIANGTVTSQFAAYIDGSDSATRYNSAEGTEADRVKAQSVTVQGLFCKSGWREYALNRSVPLNTLSASKNIAGGKLTLDGKFNGSANVRISIEYKKSDWSACIPYAVRFKEAAAKGTLDLNNARLALTASASTTLVNEKIYESDLYSGDGLVWIGPIPVWYSYAVPFEVGYKVILAASATADYSSQLAGQVKFDYVCSNGSCSGSNDTSTVSLSSARPNWSLQADATFDPYVQVGMEGRIYPVGDWYLASAGVALKLSTPLQVYGYYGTACGDANNDKQNETVNTYYADLQARASLITSWSVLGKKRVSYLSIGGWGGKKINGALYRVLNVEDRHTPIWNKRLYYTDSGNPPSIFSPVLRQQAAVSNGSQYEHQLQVSMRPCTAFDGNFFVNIVDPAGVVTAVNVPDKNTTTTVKFYSNNPNWPLRADSTRDDDGRNFASSGTPAPVLDPAPGGNGGSTGGKFSVTPSSYNFGLVTDGATSSYEFSILNNGSAGAFNVSMRSSGTQFYVASSTCPANGGTIGANVSCSVKIAFAGHAQCFGYPSAAANTLDVTIAGQTVSAALAANNQGGPVCGGK